MKIFLRILIILLFLNSCNKNYDIKNSDYEVLIENININYGAPFCNFYAKIERPYWTNECIFKYTNNPKDLLFKDSEYEIEFQRYLHDYRLKFFKPGFCLISYKRFNNQYKAIVICWTNKAKNYDTYQKTKDRKLKFSNDIDKCTDSVFSNLELKKIQKLFPDFKGKYIELKIDTVFIDNSYNVENLNYFNHIEFNNFVFGEGLEKKYR